MHCPSARSRTGQRSGSNVHLEGELIQGSLSVLYIHMNARGKWLYSTSVRHVSRACACVMGSSRLRARGCHSTLMYTSTCAVTRHMCQFATTTSKEFSQAGAQAGASAASTGFSSDCLLRRSNRHMTTCPGTTVMRLSLHSRTSEETAISWSTDLR